MNLIDLVENNEQHPVYRELESSNLARHYEFLFSIINSAIGIQRPFISTAVVKALHFHAVVGLYESAGKYRAGEVQVGDFMPVPHYKVDSLMNDCINQINWQWQIMNPIELAAWALWRINWIHPFENGNGRTSRAVCYFVLCVRAGNLLPGENVLPELLRRERDEYVRALRHADSHHGDVTQLTDLLNTLLNEQIP